VIPLIYQRRIVSVKSGKELSLTVDKINTEYYGGC